MLFRKVKKHTNIETNKNQYKEIYIFIVKTSITRIYIFIVFTLTSSVNIKNNEDEYSSCILECFVYNKRTNIDICILVECLVSSLYHAESVLFLDRLTIKNK